ncbi:hypothetical protein BKP45_02240 [Anaerobacillus alkalidiazotrophicus]|uniref:Glutamine--fructose-6-phosphate aminotransferase [isomerizing] n=1 Tax=Anaerobacillus alkalidiazotrophicus TaxID=472963 RepID=A0A1S2MA06_9BACI|nr:hypothetical protein BKP45_02240 [Anaerobacillus alkalidiazotrophicus]
MKKLGYPALTITNVPGSTLSRGVDYKLHTCGGPEIDVTSTKAYTAQMAVLSLLAVDSAKAQEMNLIAYYAALQKLRCRQAKKTCQKCESGINNYK